MFVFIRTMIGRVINFFRIGMGKVNKSLCSAKKSLFKFEPFRDSMKQALIHLFQLDYTPDIIIDVGTANGTYPLLDVYPSARYLWIEPLIEFEKDLIKLTSRYDGKYLISAAGKSNGSITLNVHDDLLGSSTLEEVDGKEVDGFPREIQLVTLDSLIDDYNLRGSVLLKIDVQGAELDVLDGAQELLNYCEVIILEVSFFKFQKNCPEFFDVINYMKNLSFVVYDIFDVNNRPLDNARGQIDVLFVKENSNFRKSHNWATLEQRGFR